MPRFRTSGTAPRARSDNDCPSNPWRNGHNLLLCGLAWIEQEKSCQWWRPFLVARWRWRGGTFDSL